MAHNLVFRGDSLAHLHRHKESENNRRDSNHEGSELLWEEGRELKGLAAVSPLPSLILEESQVHPSNEHAKSAAQKLGEAGEANEVEDQEHKDGNQWSILDE